MRGACSAVCRSGSDRFFVCRTRQSLRVQFDFDSSQLVEFASIIRSTWKKNNKVVTVALTVREQKIPPDLYFSFSFFEDSPPDLDRAPTTFNLKSVS